jgi:hypothetical protein
MTSKKSKARPAIRAVIYCRTPSSEIYKTYGEASNLIEGAEEYSHKDERPASDATASMHDEIAGAEITKTRRQK